VRVYIQCWVRNVPEMSELITLVMLFMCTIIFMHLYVFTLKCSGNNCDKYIVFAMFDIPYMLTIYFVK
jgi:hypothetical protein